MFAFADPTELWLEISPLLQSDAWQETAYSSAASRWNGYLNQVCLESVLAWIQTEQTPNATAWTTDRMARFAVWEVVNGSMVIVDNRRFALIPTEAVDDGELTVPQEWVDIPGWIADYYLAVQAEIESGGQGAWLRVWGYATHQELKTLGRYDSDDRTYCLDATDLTQDWSALWVTLQFCPTVQTQVSVPPLSELSSTQAENLIQRLATQPSPRLAVPFAQWGALIQQPNWQRQLYQQRTQANALSVNLSQWLQQQVTTGWQLLENLLTSDGRLAINFRSATPAEATVSQAKLIDLAGQTVALVVHLSRVEPTEDNRVAILVQIHPTGGQTVLPAGLELKLLAETGEMLQSVQAGAADNYIQLRRFRCPVGTAFQVKIELETAEAIEHFSL